MKNTTGYYGSSVSKNMFKTFLAMWLAIFVIALCAMLAMSSQAKADVFMPVEIQLQKKNQTAEITQFTKQASPKVVEHHCYSLLSPTKSDVMLNKETMASLRNRRNVGIYGDMSIIKAIKAYRACAREVALKEMANK